jgi:hypothetical protein
VTAFSGGRRSSSLPYESVQGGRTIGTPFGVHVSPMSD